MADGIAMISMRIRSLRARKINLNGASDDAGDGEGESLHDSAFIRR